jgi:hypothetical protein
MGEEVICVSFAKTFIHQITKTPITKIIYTREKMAYLFTLQQEIVLWILIIKSIIALSAVESWWRIERNDFVYF